ncbi:MAG: homocysteine S-methyltransferase family protein [Myxococcota bacterium]
MDFRNDLKTRVLLLDGAMGTNLISSGINIQALPDILNVENPEAVKRVMRSYYDAGSDIIRTNTFSTIRPKLSSFGIEDRLDEIARAGIRLCRSVIKDSRYLAVSIGPTGELMPPMGSVSFDQIYDYYYEIGRIYESEGVDIYWLETFTDLYELKTAVIALRDVTKRPIVALMTFDENMRSTSGSTPQIMAATISRLSIDAIGANCGVGTRTILGIIAQMKDFTDLPLVAQPNAGIPESRGSTVYYPESPEDMAFYTNDFVSNGVRILGACCGSNAEHIRKIRERLSQTKNEFILQSARPSLILTSRTNLVQITSDSPPVIVGERINPTNKQHLIDGLKKREYKEFLIEAERQISAGAQVLDINTGSPVADERYSLPIVIDAIVRQNEIPVSIDTTNDDALEKALKSLPGRALINSIQENGSLERRLLLAKRFGAAFIVLTLNEKGIPENADKRIRIAEKIVDKAIQFGFRMDDMIFDFLTLAVATSLPQMNETLKAIGEFKRRGLFTILGISNISYGLPKRSYINTSFLTLAIHSGLSAAIMDPLDKNMIASLYASSALSGSDRNFARYIDFSMKVKKADSEDIVEQINPLLKLVDSVISGKRKESIDITSELLSRKVDFKKIINDGILKAMKEVGIRFKSNQIFLPQVMLSAEAAQAAFDVIMGSVPKNSIEKKGRIVIATVEGDIHDLGKNLVASVLRNSGFEVIDLGKNVRAKDIIIAARENNVDIIALSALMTTTMGRMRDIVSLLRESGMKVPVMIGGAVVSDGFAKEIGAHYGRDAIEAVDIAEKIILSGEL